MYLCIYYTSHGLILGLGHMEKYVKSARVSGPDEMLRAGTPGVNIQ